MNAAMRCSCIYMSGGVVRGSTPGLTRQIPAAMLPTARSALSGQQLTSVRQRSRSAARKSVRAMAATATADSIYDFKVKDIDGRNKALSAFKGKVLLVTNVASECGFTPQYKALAELQEKYKRKGFEVLAFPCNQFGSQEPGDSKQIKAFAASKGFKGSLFDKVDVNGPNAEPLYDFLKSKKGGLFTKDIKWNFSKFLVGKNGDVIGRYFSTTKPEDIEDEIVKALEA